MNVRIFWVRAMKCMYAQTRPRFILSSEGVLGGMEFEPMLTPREKSPLPKMSPVEDRIREPKHYQLSYSGPMTCFCRKRGRTNSFLVHCRKLTSQFSSCSNKQIFLHARPLIAKGGKVITLFLTPCMYQCLCRQQWHRTSFCNKNIYQCSLISRCIFVNDQKETRQCLHTDFFLNNQNLDQLWKMLVCEEYECTRIKCSSELLFLTLLIEKFSSTENIRINGNATINKATFPSLSTNDFISLGCFDK